VPQAARLAPGYSEFQVYAVRLHYVDPLGRQAFERFQDLAPKLPRATEWHRKLAVLTALFGRNRPAGQSLGRVLVRAMMADLLLAGVRLKSAESHADPRVAHALARFAEAAKDPPSVSTLARESGLSAVQFRKLFRRALGVSPKQFLCRERLRRAADLLRRTSAPVKVVASDSGFSSDHYFESQFKQAYGQTPSAYRQKHRQVRM
jgi:transcriptional regulator GlxA family with amidase domain